MADKKISQLTALGAANLAPSTDVLAIVDTSATETKKIVAQDLINGVLNVASAVGIGTASPAQKLVVSDSSTTGTAINIINTSSGGYSWNLFSVGSSGGLGPVGSLAFRDSTNGVTRMVLDSSGNLGLGVTPSAWSGSYYKAIEGGDAGNQGAIAFRTDLNGVELFANSYFDGTNNIYKFTGAASLYQNTNGAHSWSTAASGTAGNAITFTQVLAVEGGKSLALEGATSQSGTGITFPATQSASSNANTLDDYEEGTFTPVISGTTTAGTGTYSVQNGAYVKIGNLVQYQIYIILTAHTGTGNITITGLPFTAIAGHYPPAAVYVDNLALTANNYPQIAVSTSSTTFLVRQMPVGGGAATAIPMDTQFDILLSGTYQV